MPGYIEKVRAMSEEQRDEELCVKVDDAIGAIIDCDLFCDLIARTNATGWGIDEFEINDASFSDDVISLGISFNADGAQEDEKAWPAIGFKEKPPPGLTMMGMWNSKML